MPVTVDIIPQATITDVTIWRSKPGLSILDKWAPDYFNWRRLISGCVHLPTRRYFAFVVTCSRISFAFTVNATSFARTYCVDDISMSFMVGALPACWDSLTHRD